MSSKTQDTDQSLCSVRSSRLSKRFFVTSSTFFNAVKARRPSTVGALLFLIPILLFIGLFFRSFSSTTRFSYRDVAFYYYPLFQQIQNEWNSGRLPLWNPYANLGQPLAADPTASVFYPGKLVFFLSNIANVSYSTCFKIYIWAHVVLMFVAAFSLARKLTISKSGSILTGLTYAFSGQTLFQYTNIIYLIGASWAPALFLFTLEFFRSKNVKFKGLAILKLSVVQALTILGGEPQIVYLTFLASLVIAFFASKRSATLKRRSNVSLPTSRLSKSRLFNSRTFSLIVFATLTAGVTFCLSAIQILPSSEIVARSSRALQEKPRSIWEIPSSLQNDLDKSLDLRKLTQRSFYDDMLCGDFSTDGRSRSIYRFSVGPWRWLEFLFPNIGGRQFPQSSRWFSAFPEETSVWTPTLYFGVFPFLLAISAFQFRSTNRPRATLYWQRSATYLVIISLLAAMGGYGLAWLERACVALFTNHRIPTSFSNYDPVGGIYWMLNVLAPKFSEFRYPAKIITLSTLGLSCLAGCGWDKQLFSARLKTSMIITMEVAGLGFLLIKLCGASLFQFENLVDSLYGPFQKSLAVKSISNAFLQTLIVLVLSQLLLVYFQSSRTTKRLSKTTTAFLLSFTLLGITGVDVFLANRWTIVTSSSSIFERESTLLTNVEKRSAINFSNKQAEFARQTRSADALTSNIDSQATPPTRIYRFPVWFPPLFQHKASPNRIDERVIWDVETLFPQYPFNKGIAIIDARGAVADVKYEKYVNELINRTNVNSDLAFLGVDYLVGPYFWTKRLIDARNSIDETRVDWRVSIEKIQKPIVRGALFRNNQRVDSTFLTKQEPQNIIETPDSIATLSYEPNNITYLATTTQSSEAVFSEQYWPDWTATIIPLSADQAQRLLDVRFDASKVSKLCQRFKAESPKEIKEKKLEPKYEFLRKTTVPQGLCCIVTTYRPRLLALGALISIISWFVLICFVIAFSRRTSNAE